MARSPQSAKAKDAAAEVMNHPPKAAVNGRRLKAPDGFVYVWSEVLAKLPGFEEFTGEADKAGFAKSDAPVEE